MAKLPRVDNIPDRIGRIPELAHNLWWSWHPASRQLFRKLDRHLWEASGHNPVAMIRGSKLLEERAKDPAFLKLYDHVVHLFDDNMQCRCWNQEAFEKLNYQPIAFLSAEFGLHQSLPIYSGGLGILGGDIAKEASDLGIPFVGLGFAYPLGYFRQRILPDGWQEAEYEELDYDDTALVPIKDNNHMFLPVETPGRTIYVRLWSVKVGMSNLFLMDTDVEQNAPWDRELSSRLYGGDQEIRLRQEIVLGFGSAKILEALNITPSVWHLNEGHTVFSCLQRIQRFMEAGNSFKAAIAKVKARTLFTTHTPVPAGHDMFSFSLIRDYFKDFWENLGITEEDFLGLGRWNSKYGEAYNMTALGLRLSSKQNAVSRINGQVCNDMWAGMLDEENGIDAPIDYITNGVHVPTWISEPMYELFAKHLGDNWLERQDETQFLQKIRDIPNFELWNAKQKAKTRLFSIIRERLRRARVESNLTPEQIIAGGIMLDPEALTIGFARRFATYKRAALILEDVERIKTSLLDPYRPVQIIFAGKAHPADDPGKKILQKIYNMAEDTQLGGRIAFVDNYDMQIARYMVQGVDVWLNTPRRPHEASGTSGQKAAVNGCLNFSVLDGWWPEGYNGGNGWVIGEGSVLESESDQDTHDLNSLYNVLENEIVTLYYRRGTDGIPHEWLEVVKNSMYSILPKFSARRMVKEYTKTFYLPLGLNEIE